MRKKLILGMVALSLASGFMVFGKPVENKMAADTSEVCTPGCCENDREECEPACCRDTELCCE